MTWLILILGILLRLVNLNQSFWLDEAAQAVMSSKSLQSIWFERNGDFQPPLFYILAHFWMQFGKSEVWLRILPVSFGIATVILVYKHWGNWAGFLLAINPYHIYYSQEFRMYSLLCLLGVWSMILFIKRSKWLFLINALLLYTHYSSVFLIITQLFLGFSYFKKQILLVFLLFIPWLPQFWLQFHTGANIDQTLPGWRNILTLSPIKAIPEIFFKFVAGRINMIPRLTYAIYIAFVLMITFVSLVVARGNKLLWIWLGLPIILSLAISFWIPQTQPFRLIYCLPALLIILAQACKRFPKLFITLFVYITITGNVLYFTRERLQREQWRQAITFLRGQKTDVMLRANFRWVPFDWYAPELPIVLTPSKQQVLLVDYLGELTDPNRQVEKHLIELGYSQTRIYNFEGVGFIRLYTKS